MSKISVWPPPAPQPATKLGRHRQLSPLAGVRVSPICLGAMSIGDQWEKYGMGSMDKEASFKLLDAFYEAGGNFIDTANNYQDETSEKFIGEWMEKRGNRDQLVIATKYSTHYGHEQPALQKTQFMGNSTKSMHLSVEASLKKLRTTYIDILYVHWWEYAAPVEEVMNSLHHLVASGKVLYLGISDTPAWVVSKANMYARLTGKTPFVIYQGAWSVLQRDFERDIIPMARAEGLALAPWNVLAGGKVRSDAEEQKRRETGEKGRAFSGSAWERNEDQRKMSLKLEEIAKEVGAKHVSSVAIAYVMQKTPYVFPIIGGRKVEHLLANIEALDIALTSEHIKSIESVLPFDPGFPNRMVGDGTANTHFINAAGYFDRWPLQEAIRPAT